MKREAKVHIKLKSSEEKEVLGLMRDYDELSSVISNRLKAIQELRQTPPLVLQSIEIEKKELSGYQEKQRKLEAQLKQLETQQAQKDDKEIRLKITILSRAILDNKLEIAGKLTSLNELQTVFEHGQDRIKHQEPQLIQSVLDSLDRQKNIMAQVRQLHTATTSFKTSLLISSLFNMPPRKEQEGRTSDKSAPPHSPSP